MTIGRGGGGEGLGGRRFGPGKLCPYLPGTRGIRAEHYLPRRAATELTVIATITVPKT